MKNFQKIYFLSDKTFLFFKGVPNIKRGFSLGKIFQRRPRYKIERCPSYQGSFQRKPEGSPRDSDLLIRFDSVNNTQIRQNSKRKVKGKR